MSTDVARIPATDRPDRPPLWTAVVGFLVVLPSLLFVVLNMLRWQFGVHEPYETLRPVVQPTSELANAILAAVALLGPPAGFILAMWHVLRAGLRRDAGWLVGTLRVRLSWPHIAVALVAMATAAFLYGHLAIEAIQERWP